MFVQKYSCKLYDKFWDKAEICKIWFWINFVKTNLQPNCYFWITANKAVHIFLICLKIKNNCTYFVTNFYNENVKCM